MAASALICLHKIKPLATSSDHDRTAMKAMHSIAHLEMIISSDVFISHIYCIFLCKPYAYVALFNQKHKMSFKQKLGVNIYAICNYVKAEYGPALSCINCIECGQ